MIDLDGLLETGRTSRVRVGIGLPPERLAPTAGELRDMDSAIELVGYDDSRALAEALSSKEVGAAVRGTLSSIDVLKAVAPLLRTESVMRVAVMSRVDGRPFLLAPVGIDEGNDLGQRLELARRAIAYFKPAGWHPEVGVLSRGRPEDKDRGEEIRRSLEDGETIERVLTTDGVPAKHYSILVEEAVRDRDLILAPDGVAGNLMFRTLHFVCAGRSYGAPIVNLSEVFVDTSRAKMDFTGPVLLAAGLAQLGCRA